MSAPIVIGFPDEFKADEVLLDLRKLEREHLIDLEDAAIVVKNKDGKVRVNQTQELVTIHSGNKTTIYHIKIRIVN